MNRTQLLMTGTLVATLGCASFWFIVRKDKPAPTPVVTDDSTVSVNPPAAPQAHFDESKELQTRWDEMRKALNSPIDLYGKVVDQHGNPVHGATVSLSLVNDQPKPEGDRMEVVLSDADGRFAIKGRRGFSLGVRANKEGYMNLPPLGGPSSSAMVYYGSDSIEGKRFSNPNTPLVLTMHLIGEVEPNFYVAEKNWRLPVDGTVRNIALDTKEGRGVHEIEFRFKSDWGSLPNTNERYGMRYDWSLEVKIPGGGFAQNNDPYNFEAPESGYQESIKIEYLATMAESQWERSDSGKYFVRFSDGSYGRIRFSIDGGSGHSPLSMVSWLSLKPGSRNLASHDFDPTYVPH